MMHHDAAPRSIGRSEIAPNTPDGTVPVAHSFAAAHRVQSHRFEAACGEADLIDACSEVPVRYLRERRRPIADPALNLIMINDAVEALKETGWALNRDPCPVSVRVEPLHPLLVEKDSSLVAKDLFKLAKQAPLSLLQFPLLSSTQRPHAAAARPEVFACAPSAATPAPVPRFKHCDLFASAVADSRSPRPRHAIAMADDERQCRSSRLQVLSGRKAAGAEAADSAVAEGRSAIDGAMQPPTASQAHSSRHLLHPDDCNSPKVSVSRFDFRSQ